MYALALEELLEGMARAVLRQESDPTIVLE
jgi:hypothetical protein